MTVSYVTYPLPKANLSNIIKFLLELVKFVRVEYSIAPASEVDAGNQDRYQ
jgi:hypothetical protein